jgi:RecQ-mediated genome instability protein 1
MEIAQQLHTALSKTTTPHPTQPNHQNQTTARNPPPPLASLLATARTRLLASDLTTPDLLDKHYIATHALPPNLQATAPSTRELRLTRDVVVQVLDLEDVSRSRWEQVEELEAVARGEGTRGREVVRLPAGNADEDGEGQGEGGQQQAQPQQQQGQGGSSKNSTHKLVVQDCKGQKVHALELKRVEAIGVGKTLIGEKILLKVGTVVARGVVMLEPAQCMVLGGKVEAWHRAWVDGRLARLRETVGAVRR